MQHRKLTRIIPALPAPSEQSFYDAVAQVAAPVFQLDVADGTFSEHTTWFPDMQTKFQLGTEYELHVMAREPEQFVELLRGPVARIIVHVEAFGSHAAMHAFADEVHRRGREVGFAFLMKTDIAPHRSIIEFADTVQLMSIDVVGRHGEPFNEAVFERIDELVSYGAATIAIDGGVKEQHIAPLVQKGVQMIGMGSAILGSSDPHASYVRFQEIANTTYDE